MIHAALLSGRRGRNIPLWVLIVKLTALLFMLCALIYSEYQRKAFREACGCGYNPTKFHSAACQAFYK